METATTNSQFLTPKETAASLKVCKRTLPNLEKRGILHPVYIGGIKRYLKRELDRLAQGGEAEKLDPRVERILSAGKGA